MWRASWRYAWFTAADNAGSYHEEGDATQFQRADQFGASVWWRTYSAGRDFSGFRQRKSWY